MISTIKSYFGHKDSRGEVTGLINTGEWRELNLVTTHQGQVRGNHYHKTTTEAFIVLSGEIRVDLRRPLGDNWETSTHTFQGGDVFIIESGVEHTFFATQDSTWINMLDNPMDETNPDFHKFTTGETG